MNAVCEVLPMGDGKVSDAAHVQLACVGIAPGIVMLDCLSLAH